MDFAHLLSRSVWKLPAGSQGGTEPFDLVSGPLWRAKLLAVPSEHILVLIFHHIVCDGWSIGVLMRELVAGYEAFLRGNLGFELPMRMQITPSGRASRLPDQPFSATSNWRKHLEGVTGAIQIPLTSRVLLSRPFVAHGCPRRFRRSLPIASSVAYSEGAHSSWSCWERSRSSCRGMAAKTISSSAHRSQTASAVPLRANRIFANWRSGPIFPETQRSWICLPEFAKQP
jgi:hypothetical protein